MLDHIVDSLVCPLTRQPLSLISFEKSQEKYNGEVRDRTLFGLLMTPDSIAYPVIRGIPRLLQGAMSLFKEDLKGFSQQIDAANVAQKSYEVDPEFEEWFLPTLESFQLEWQKHEIDGENTWGLTQADRMDRQREYMGFHDEQKFPGQIFMDAGAGTGQLTCTMAQELDTDIIGVDITSSIERGEMLRRSIERSGHVLFVQANLSMPLPFKDGLFDFIYSNGVLHHTPDTKATYENLVPFNKVGGKFSVWLYNQGQDDMPIFPYLNMVPVKNVRPTTKNWNKSFLHTLVTIWVTLIFIFIHYPKVFITGKSSYGSRQDVITLIYDAISPQFAYIHTPAEVTGWYEAHGYADIFESDFRNGNGFNICGTKVA